ncbi:CheY-like receiver [Magnetospirillum sp. LM-5]|uniref:response regulator n=1 Tax=Magnetospirillum sp. LM-5 TaxID=2681466 RepID=UPI00137C402D|nr:response regulator [Magnetospirillum sp. LM-5]CAA7621300.1 CheY-like receiver [Magnetospirillum sp. LM-5]
MSENELLEWVADKSIIVVEDESSSRMVLAGLLRSIGATKVRVATNGEDALRQIETKGVPDIIFCDWMMPEMDGLTLLSVVKPLHPGVRFVMVTSKKEPDDVRTAAALKVDGYVVKPYARATLMDSLARLRAKEA